MNDYLAIAVAFVYVFAALGLAEALRKLLKLPVEFTRKVVHIAVGMWAWGTIALFDSKWLAIAEACSPNGLDNLFVPAASVAGWRLAHFALGSV